LEAIDMATAVQMGPIERLRKFINDVKLEAQKVSWPSRDEVKESTIVVLVAVFIISIFIYVVDIVISRLIQVVL